jgi:glycosyltransferase involved in cell wall biosynthesis
VRNGAPGPILYLVTRFPKVTETFVVNEWWALADRFPLEFAALLRERGPAVHPRSAALLPRVRFVGLLDRATVRANLAALRSRPRLYARTLRDVLRASPATAMGNPVKSLVTFWKAVRLAEIARSLGVRHVHAHFINQPATAAWIVQRLEGIPFSVTVHANDLFAGPALLGEKVRDAAFVAAISDYNVRYVRERVREGGRVEVVRCGVELERFPFAERGGGSILCVARLFPTKGHADLLRAFAGIARERPDATLDLVGDGPERERLDRLAAELGIAGRVRFHGALAADDVPPLLAGAGVFALASVPDEAGAMDGIPVALMEAMAAGVPVVATELSGIPELVVDGETGLLVPPGRPDALEAAMRRLLDDAELRSRLARRAREHVAERFSLASETERLAALFEEALARPAPVRT